MHRYDTKWMNSEYCYFDGMGFKLKPNAPREIQESYEHYEQQKRERFGKKKDKTLKNN